MKPVRVSLGFTSGSSFLSSLIRKLDSVPGVKPVNHCFWKFYFDKDDNQQSLVYESHLKGGVQITPWERVAHARTVGKIYRISVIDIGLGGIEAQRIWDVCWRYLHGKSYDVRRIIGYYIWIKVTKRKSNSMLNFHRKNMLTCNEFIISSAHKAEIAQFENIDYSYTPNKLLRHFDNGDR